MNKNIAVQPGTINSTNKVVDQQNDIRLGSKFSEKIADDRKTNKANQTSSVRKSILLKQTPKTQVKT